MRRRSAESLRRPRRWRKRGRRAQVSAIVTILGLLIVVSFVANYLSTTLPRQMTLNDVNHELQVENQLGQLAAAFQQYAQAGVRDVPLTQVISLGSQGLAPFAAPDGGSVSSTVNQTNASLSLGLVTSNYNPPVVVPTFVITPKQCSPANTSNSTSVVCTGQGVVDIGFKVPAGNYTYTVSGGGGSNFTLNFQANNSNAFLNATGSGNKPTNERILLVGNDDNISLTGNGGVVQTVEVIGYHDSVKLTETSKATVNVTLVGDHDAVNVTKSGGSSSTFNVSGWGSYDSFVTSNSGGTYSVNYTAFNATAPNNAICPFGNQTDDTVSPIAFKGAPTASVTYNNDTSFPDSLNKTTHNNWTTSRENDSVFPCIFFASFGEAPVSGLAAATIIVHLRNSYAPDAEVALDQGAVVLAQPGGVPVMVDPPPITLTGGVASVSLPAFLGTLASQSGTGTLALDFTERSSQQYSFPGSGWVLNPSQPLKLLIATPYFAAWMNYFCSAPAFQNASISVLVNGVHYACGPAWTTFLGTYHYTDNGPQGTITLGFPKRVATRVSLHLAVFAPGSGS